MIAASIIWAHPSAKIADPLCTFGFSILVLFTTYRLMKQCIAILMEGTPDNLKMPDIETALKAIDGVAEVRELHAWSLTVGKPSLSVHLYISASASQRRVLQHAHHLFTNKFKVHHTTIQVERLDQPMECGTCKSQDAENIPLL